MAKKQIDAQDKESPLIDPSMATDGLSSKAKAGAVKTKPKRKKSEPDKGGFIWGTGRRKRSVARVRIKPGKGELLVNKKGVNDYFVRPQDRDAVIAPLKATDTTERFDVFVNVKGGGTSGQAGAAMLGIARALRNFDESLIKPLRDGGYLTRDGRMVERKKYGQRGARRRFQFSKR
jgi:small subunit ribosomal protein S9